MCQSAIRLGYGASKLLSGNSVSNELIIKYEIKTYEVSIEITKINFKVFFV